MICRNCESINTELVIDLGMQPWGNHFLPIADDVDVPQYPLEIFFCNECTMVQLGFTVPKEVMFVEHNYVSGTTNALKKHFKIVADEILEKVQLNDHDYILDIGGNDGTFLQQFDHKVKVLNVDSGMKQAEISNQAGIECINDFFNLKTAQMILATKGQAKVIHGSGILFHLEELHSVFEGIQLLLAKDGSLVAEFIYLPGMVAQGAYDQIYHEHLLYYTMHSFNHLLAQHGLEIYDAEILSIHGGSCLAYIGHVGQFAKTKKYVSLLQAELAGRYHQIETYRAFAKRIVEMKNKLTQIIHNLKAEGKSIQAMGAPVKGSTIINYCKLTHNELDCAVEINELKCDTYMPGTKIPVYHQFKTAEPDAYLLLSWNFKDEIMSRLGAFRARGGKIISPLPEPEVL